jgi:adenine-specific DNA-methyltransferase
MDTAIKERTMRTYNELIRKLKEIFQIDRTDLDFGVYRILNARAAEISDYLEKHLKIKVQQALGNGSKEELQRLQIELSNKLKQYEADGVDGNQVPKIQELRHQINSLSNGSNEYENAIFSHLLTFFSRYYDSGDFISQRRFKGDTYAIPYSGEEVVLHWANKDQYYTKSGENFSNYTFKLSDGRAVHCRLVSADTAKDNRKDNDKERRFVLIDTLTRTLTDEDGEEYEQEFVPILEVNGELVLHFSYAPMPKGTKQSDLTDIAVKRILENSIVRSYWVELSQLEPTDAKPNRTLLDKHLNNYTTKNSADYFIHKDLGRFLQGELDFYIKSEVMHLDDIQHASTFADLENKLRMIQCLRSIALDIITFLAQLEDFQKKLWLKKKFVVAAHYCLTLDRVPVELYEEIAANEKQWLQWRELGMLIEQPENDLFSQPSHFGSVEYLKAHTSLMVDTSIFGPHFKEKLLASVDNLDENIDGLLVHGDNFQGLNLLKERYRSQINCVYIDPPYNTNASEILYKNGYRDSSWLSLMFDRLVLSKEFMNDTSIKCVTIDDFEFNRLSMMMESLFSANNILGYVAIKNNPSGRSTAKGFSIAHEYAIFCSNSENTKIGRLERNEEQNARYNLQDNKGKFEWVNFRKHGGVKEESPKMYYPIYVSDKGMRVPSMQWNDAKDEWDILEHPHSGEEVTYPIDEHGLERRWKWGLDRVLSNPQEFSVKNDRNKQLAVYVKARVNDDGMLPLTIWDKGEYSSTSQGTNLVKNIFGNLNSFSYPKSIFAVQDCLRVSNISSESIVLDYFAGSGTTAHAVIALNRQDREQSKEGKRKYILVEQGEYFDTVLKPRVQKVVYSADWKDGKPTAPQTGISHAFKVLKLESYEDTLNNLELKRSEAQDLFLNLQNEKAREDYLLRYMLEIESRGSLLSVDTFRKPFQCKLKVSVDSAGSFEDKGIDLVETFNYLIGLRVKSIDSHQDKGYVWVEGHLPTGEKTLVLWRDCDLLDYEELNKFCERRSINPRDTEFELIYVNGDHNIPSVLTTASKDGGMTQNLKLRTIESDFLSRMFGEGV